MKRLLSIMVVILLLSGLAAAEGLEESVDILTCDHEFTLCAGVLEAHQWCIRDVEEKADLFVSAVCEKCGTSGVVFDDKNLLEAEPCAPQVCTHRMYRLRQFDRSVWRTVGEQMHQRMEYSVCVCIDCGLIGTLVAVKEAGMHQMEIKPGFHIEGQYIHVTCQECELCGMMTGGLIPCISYEEGTCEKTK